MLLDLGNSPAVVFPRWVAAKNESDIQLHVYADTSKHACCAVASIRVGDAECAAVSMLFAKVRLAPKEITIPRLELLAVLIAARIVTFLAKELAIQFSRNVLWTDSKCALHWLRSVKVLSVFVANRLKEIRRVRTWNFVMCPLATTVLI